MSFISDIYGNLRGHIAIVTRGEDGQLSSERWFNWPDEQSFIEKYISIRSDEDVYNSVGVFNEEERTREDTEAKTNVVWADADMCAPGKFLVPPSKVVQTSPDKWHVWWLLTEPVLLSEASHLARQIAAAHADDGCDHGWHASKILRVPGTSNTKYETPYEVTETDSGARYTLDDLRAAYGSVDVTPQTVLDAAVPDPVSEERLAELESTMELAGLSHLYTDKPGPGQSWSERMYRLELDLFRQGLSAQEVFSLMREAPINKYNPENEGGGHRVRCPHPASQEPRPGHLAGNLQGTRGALGDGQRGGRTDQPEDQAPRVLPHAERARVGQRQPVLGGQVR